jgi:hypothetical protein
LDFEIARERLLAEFGEPARETAKVVAWEKNGIGIVLQIDQPNRDPAAYIWLPYPEEGGSVPEVALEYAAESGRHSGTYASAGLEKVKPALKLIVRTARELEQTVDYVRAMAAKRPLPSVVACPADREAAVPATAGNTSVSSPSKRPRREAIPRAVQREVWRRDEGRCVECSSKERLCFDHIIPFSRGGSSTGRNLQLLCERCNLSKGNRI